MTLLDVHAHYGMKEYASYPKDSGVVIILNGMDYESNCFALSESKKNPLIKAALGFHPLEVSSAESLLEAKKIITHIKTNPSLVAIGEVGLDHFHCKDIHLQRLQATIFDMMITLAQEMKKPLIIHARNTADEVLTILEKRVLEKTFSQGIVLHCFEASEKNIKRAISLGCYFTIPASVKRNEHFQKLVSLVPISKLFTETDGPFQGPRKGTPAIPTDVIHALEYIAKEKGLAEKEVENLIFMNYLKLFS